jgi:cobalt/nickel transport system permease protein
MHKLATAHSEELPVAAPLRRILRFDIRARLLGGLLLIVCIVGSAPMGLAEFAATLAALLICAVLIGDKPPEVLRGAAVVLAFAGVIAVLAPLALVSHWTAANLTAAYAQGWPLITEILSKAFLSALTVNIVMKSATLTAVLQGLEALHLPRIFCMLLTFLYRFSDLFREQIRAMQAAIASRAPRLGRARRLLLYGRLGGNLFVRAVERAEHIYDAMLSRGYTGTLPTTQRLRWRAPDTAALTLCALMGLSVLFI